MMTISAMTGGGVNYYTFLAQEDYYLKGGEPPGRWWGEAAKVLGLPEQVTRTHLRRLFKGQSPRGSRLVQNAGSAERQPGWDVTFSAPKTVSVLWSQVPELRQTIQECQRDAVDFAMRYLERTAGLTRRGKGGTITERAKLVVAGFQHGTSRELDPQLHDHMLILNVGLRADGTFGTILSHPFFTAQKLVGALYRTELANLLSKRTGITCEREKFSFKVRHIPEALAAFFSKRHDAIEEHLKSKGLGSAAAAAIAALDTRDPKDFVPPRATLFEKWEQEGRRFGFDPSFFRNLRLGRAVNASRVAKQALQEALTELTSEAAYFQEAQLLQLTAVAAQGKGIGAEKVIEAVTEAIAKAELVTPSSPHLKTSPAQSLRRLRGKAVLLKVMNPDGTSYYTTPAVWQSELKLHSVVSQLSRAARHGTSRLAREASIAYFSRSRSLLEMELTHEVVQLWKAFRREKTSRPTLAALRGQGTRTLTAEQADAVRYLTSRKGRSIRMLEGDAGAGKTSTLRAVATAYQLSGYKTVGVCVSGKAARELRDGAGIGTYTFEGFLVATNPSADIRLRYHMKQLGRAACKLETYSIPRLKLTKRTVLIVDESSMLSTPDALRLTRMVRRSGALMICVGDRKQLQAIGPGGWFSDLCDRLGKAELTTNLRQRDPADVELATAAAQGNGQKVIANLVERNRLVVAPDRDEAIARLVTDWRDRHQNQRDQVLIFAGTNRETSDINARCQAERLALKEIRRRRFTKIHSETEDGQRVGYKLHVGDRVLFTKRSRRHGVENGDTGTLLNIVRRPHIGGTRLIVQLDNGSKVKVPLRRHRLLGRGYDAKDVRLGYAMTTHKGQGTTTDYAYILAGGSMQHKELTYVQLTRAREAVYVYSDRHEAGPNNRNLARQFEQSREKQMALRLQSKNPSHETRDETHQQRL